MVNTDKEKLNAIFFNLIKNAVKYMKNGSIEFGLSIIANNISEEIPVLEELRFFVKDTGIGIPVDRQKAVSERFIQADILDKMPIRAPGLDCRFRKLMLKCLEDGFGWKAK